MGVPVPGVFQNCLIATRLPSGWLTDTNCCCLAKFICDNAAVRDN